MLNVDYFGFRAVPHPNGCTRPGWEVMERREIDLLGGPDRALIIRIVCPQPKGCGAYHEWQVSLCQESDPETGDPHSGVGTRCGSVEAIGYGTAPIKVSGVWLHASRPLLLLRPVQPPDYYLVTASEERPRRWQDLLGIVGQVRSSRSASGYSKRWHAAADYQEGKWGPGPTRNDDQLSSRTAAVRWVVEQAVPYDRRADMVLLPVVDGGPT